MSTVTLLEEIDELERRLVTARQAGPLLAVADDDEDEEDLFGEDDLGFDNIDEEDADEDVEPDSDAELDEDEPADDDEI